MLCCPHRASPPSPTRTVLYPSHAPLPRSLAPRLLPALLLPLNVAEMLYPEFRTALALLPPLLLRNGKEQNATASVLLDAYNKECEAVKKVR